MRGIEEWIFQNARRIESGGILKDPFQIEWIGVDGRNLGDVFHFERIQTGHGRVEIVQMREHGIGQGDRWWIGETRGRQGDGHGHGDEKGRQKDLCG